MRFADLLLVVLGGAFLVSAGCGPAGPATPKIEYRWEPIADVQPGGILGERLRIWRERRLWRVSDDPFLLAGFESPPGEQAWQGEHVGKWLHAATLAYEATHDPKLLERLQETVRRLLRAQGEDGYLGTYAPDKRFQAPPGNYTKRSWDVWTHRYVLYGLLTYERFHPDPAVVEACTRIGDLLLATFGPGKRDLTHTGTRRGLSSATLLESIVMLYARTGEQRFLDFAEHLHRCMENNEGLRVVSRLTSGGDVEVPGDGKAYQLMAVLLGYAELYRFTGKGLYRDAAVKAWENIRADHTYETGGPWSYKSDEVKNDECFARKEFFDPTNRVENCSTTTWVQLSLELLRLTGEARYAAEAERAMLNHLFGAQSPDGVDWAYFTPPNCPRREYNGVINCCGSSGPRALEMYARHLIGTDGEALTLNTYLPLTAKLNRPHPALKGIEISGNYPFEERVSVALDLDAAAEFPVDLIVPDGVESIRVSIDDRPAQLKPTPAGYLRLKRTWRPGERMTVNCEFGLQATYREGRGHQPWVSFKHGPLALAEEVSEAGYQNTAPLRLSGRRPEAAELLEAVPSQGGDRGPVYRIRGTDIELKLYYLAGATGNSVRTLFAVAD